jgi:hypothetical protein
MEGRIKKHWSPSATGKQAVAMLMSTGAMRVREGGRAREGGGGGLRL